jgi:hypothetical protein
MTVLLSLLSKGVISLVCLAAYRRSQRVRYLVRTALYFLALALSSLTGMIVAPPLFLLGLGRFSNYVVGLTARVLIPTLTGTRVRVIGRHHLESHRPCVFVANHQARLDMFTMYDFLAKDFVNYLTLEYMAKEPRPCLRELS